MNKRIIINADDCGLSTAVNQAIETCILSKRLTSTTIMACGDDIPGAKRLFDDYASIVSFGCHLCLDEGKPFLYNQILVDKGFVKYINGEWRFTRRLWDYSYIGGELKNALIDECCAQIEFLFDNGFAISHIDSHHHVHTSKGLLWLYPIIGKKYGITRYRRVRNDLPMSFSYLTRQLWNSCIKIQYPKSMTTDLFCPVSHMFDNEHIFLLGKEATIELMCHPGHSDLKFQKEIDQLLSHNQLFAFSDYELITYNQL